MAGSEVDFDLLFVGLGGKAEVVPKWKREGLQMPLATVPVGLPPIVPDIEYQLEELLTCPEKLPIHDADRSQRFWGREPNPESLYSLDLDPIQTTIKVDRNQTTGELVGYKEEILSEPGSTRQKSMSLLRPPGPPTQSVRGSSGNIPFWPGGVDEPILDTTTPAGVQDMDFENNLLSVPPGFNKGLLLESDPEPENAPPAEPEVAVLSVADILANSDGIEFSDEEEEEEEGRKEEEEEKEVEMTEEERKAAEAWGMMDDGLEVIVKAPQAPVTPTKPPEPPKEEWAIPVDISTPVADFYKRIPNMAYKWPFELDVFQKQAILHLENHESVFVAAHTSAGKTVVAEYAIALSMKHMTRTVYTSPIKALSNQKFRDFKTTFGDVGLITGDVQLHPEAACLIMTTEILRSMLYNGSDVIRDLEWVIFDEVHYINDAERGVVWEEVLIMLPQHVNIILLSATVPNTIEFADWIGRTKRKKIYVISTAKRPVPLEHFLYTGNSNKTINELFLLVDSKRTFLTRGYQKAIEAKKERATKLSQTHGAKGIRQGNPHQDKNVLLSMIEMLRKKEQLPCVTFTFSKRKIEENIYQLRSVDLTTAAEKSEIHIFVQRCITKLKPPDRKLPQVTSMTDILKRGLGIHHSGILPILKEVVEMLFQKGLVKILFATETFAMGVNMPARTVVFNMIQKHDGTAFRYLLPGEYIQMAGRAGRRGLDTTGTVIILCKGDVPEMHDLHMMMLGKPTLLTSQFRLTYSMILNLLRVEQLRVEDMMKRSFSEFHTQKDTEQRKDNLKILKTKMADIKESDCYMCAVDLEKYYLTCQEYWELANRLQKLVLTHPAAVKALSPGRVVVVDTEKYKNTLGVILESSNSNSTVRTFTTLVLCEQDMMSPSETESGPKKNVDTSEVWEAESVRPVMETPLFQPEGPCGQVMVKLVGEELSVISTKTIKIQADRIIDDIRKREMPRFRNDPVGQSTSVATQELLRITEANAMGLTGLDPLKDLHLRDIDLVEEFRRLKFLKESFANFVCVNCPKFTECFEEMHKNMSVKQEFEHMKYLLSDASLQLLPEYQQRIEVLRGLGYLDEHNTVQLKGRVACEISNHELLITELVFENVLTSLLVTEIAALLSCVVFQDKRCDEPNLTETLKDGKESIIKVARQIGELQKQCGLRIPVEDFVDELKFGLVEVVFEWAKQKPFSDIMELTNVQEGIIVRSIQRLDEVIKDVRNAARIIGDPVLYSKMDEASMLIKRDIVFAASLYTQ